MIEVSNTVLSQTNPNIESEAAAKDASKWKREGSAPNSLPLIVSVKLNSINPLSKWLDMPPTVGGLE